MTYIPSEEVLDKYANVLVNFALNSGNGVKKGEVVFLQVPECAKPLLISLRRAVLKRGAFSIAEYLPDDYSREFYELASDEQLSFFPGKYLKGKVAEADHTISIIAETNKYELKGVNPEKIMKRSIALRPYMEWRNEKEVKGKFTWTLALYGTEAMAKEASMTLKEYWQEIINGCYLDFDDPIRKWKKTYEELDRIKHGLNSLKISKLNVKSKSIDLNVKIGLNREWLGGSGRNIPSFELFISPDWRGTSGYISFDQPLYRYGNMVNGISLEFKNGLVVKATADKNQKLLREMIKVKDADKIGEFSLTDKRFSRISKFMGETLFDENIGSMYGNTHIALGSAYKDSYPGNQSKITKSKWKEMGYNDSVVHTDIISTEDRVVTASLEDGSRKVIYKSGKFTL